MTLRFLSISSTDSNSAYDDVHGGRQRVTEMQLYAQVTLLYQMEAGTIALIITQLHRPQIRVPVTDSQIINADYNDRAQDDKLTLEYDFRLGTIGTEEMPTSCQGVVSGVWWTSLRHRPTDESTDARLLFIMNQQRNTNDE